MNGGHDVPITKIVSCYQKSIINCSRIVQKVPHRAYLYDNFEKVTKIVRIDILTDFDYRKEQMMKRLLVIIVCVFIHTSVISQTNYDKILSLKKYYSKNYDSLAHSFNYADTLNKMREQIDSLAYLIYQEDCEQFNKTILEIDTIIATINSATDISVKRENLLYLYTHSLHYPDFCCAVRQNSNKLIPICSDYKDNDYVREVLLIINLPNNLKDSVLKYEQNDELSREFRARLGDTIAENQIINEFTYLVQNLTTETELDELDKICNEMMFVGTDKCTRALVSYFDCNRIIETDKYAWVSDGSNIVRTKKGKYITSILEHLLSYYCSYHPMCFELSRANVVSHSDPVRWRTYGFVPTQFELDLFRQIEKYCHNTYGVVLHIDLPFLGLHDYDDYAEDCGLDVKSIIERYK